jgi:sugar lactone lactonase YvrE
VSIQVRRFPKALCLVLAWSTALALASPACALGAPAPPGELIAVEGASQIALSWKAPAGEDLSGYEILLGTRRLATTDRYTTDYLATGLESGRSYTFTVRALEGSTAGAGAGITVSTMGTSSLKEISACSANAIGSGHYLLNRNLVAPPGEGCLHFESPEHKTMIENVTLDCQGHSIAEERGSLTTLALVTFANLKRFFMVNCHLEVPDPVGLPMMLTAIEASSGAIDANTFSAAENKDTLRIEETKDVAVNSNRFTNVMFELIRGVEDYFGMNTMTSPSQASAVVMESYSSILADEDFLAEGGSKNRIDGNSFNGAAHVPVSEGKPYELPLYGADDIFFESGESEDVTANNVLGDAFDCSLEVGARMMRKDGFIDNYFDAGAAAGLCDYASIWRENALIGNESEYGGPLFAFGPPNPWYEGVFVRNNFESNYLGDAYYHNWHTSALFNNFYEYEGRRPEIGENVFTKNEFGASLPAPEFKKVEARFIGSQSENNCKPAVEMEPEATELIHCGVPGAPKAEQPRVFGIYPDIAPTTGGKAVSIEGASLAGATEVLFGATQAKILKVINDTRLVVEAPAAAAGETEVFVVSGSRSKASANDRFAYAASVPAVASVSPATGPPSGGTAVTISGQDLSEATAVNFGPIVEHRCSENGQQPCFLVEGERIKATTPASPAEESFVNVSVTTPAGTSAVTEGIPLEAGLSANDQFTYAEITSISPDSGPIAGAQTIHIKGSDLGETKYLYFGEVAVEPLSVGGSEIVAVAPAHAAGTVDVRARTEGGSTPLTAADQYTYGPPVVSAVTPNEGSLGGGNTVTIRGLGFNGAEKVLFGSKSATFSVGGAGSEITATVPAGEALGAVAVRVVGPGGTSAESSNDDYSYVQVPSVGSVSPESGPEAGEAQVTIRGSGLNGATSVMFGLSPAQIRSDSASELTVIAPAGAGTVNVRVGNVLGESPVSASDRYTYNIGTLSAPTITNVQPDAGSLAGGTEVIISGTNLNGASEVLFGSTPAKSFTVDSASMISAVSPAAASAGTVAVSVRTPAGLSGPSAGAQFSYRVVGPAVGFGGNSLGQLGDGSTSNSDLPIQAQGGGEALAVAGGGAFSLALMRSGTVESYGSNESGELGDESTQSSAVPVAVRGLGEEVQQVAAGGEFALALLKGGAVEAWGANRYGQLGSGAGVASSRPEPVCTVAEAPCASNHYLSEVAAVAAGEDFSLALMKNGTVMAWGDNVSGQLGDGSTESSSVPVEVKGLSEVVAIAAGSTHALALLKNGTVMAWGENGSGELGDGSDQASTVPVAVKELEGVVGIAAGTGVSYALRAGGEVLSWGANLVGELGDGSCCVDRALPGAVSGRREVGAIAAGGGHALALLQNGTVMSWGENLYGELGDGTTSGPDGCPFGIACATAPVAVEGLSEAAAIGAGDLQSLASGLPQPRVQAVSPGAGPTSGGTVVTISGANFGDATEVRFGGAQANAFEVRSQSTIIATAPALAQAGIVDVMVGNQDGSSAIAEVDKFNFGTPPTFAQAIAIGGQPGSLAVDPQGDLWISEWYENAIEERSPAGEVIRRLSALEGSCRAPLEGPEGIAVAGDGDLWVVDGEQDRLLELSPEGKCLREIGASGSGAGQFSSPGGVAIGPNGHIWVADSGNARIEELSENGEYLGQFGSFGSAAGQFEWPNGVAVDAQGHVWVADALGERVQELSEAGTPLGEVSARLPSPIVVDSHGNIFVSELGGGQVRELNPELQSVALVGSAGSGPGQYRWPAGLAVQPNGTLWVSDQGNERIERWSEAW